MRRAYVLMVLFAALLPQAAGAGDAALFHGFRTLRPFLHELWFDDYDPDVSGKALSTNRIGFAFDLYPTSAAKLAENREYFRSEILPELDSIRDGVRDPALDIWITVHSAVYDIPNRTLRIVAQEDFDHPFDVRLR